MGWKRKAIESLVSLAECSLCPARALNGQPDRIFILRNNDLGDVLVMTPLLDALKRRFPSARMVVGVGPWAMPILEGNPHVDSVLPINAPWHNSQVKPQGLRDVLTYLMQSPEIGELRRQSTDVGIDYLGSPQGSLLLMRSGIATRLGVRGYAGDGAGCSETIPYCHDEHVARMGLRFAELLGARDLPEVRPQLFGLPAASHPGAIVVAPGGGYPQKLWPLANWTKLVASIRGRMVVIGSHDDRDAGRALAAANPLARDLTGRLSLRESFAEIAAARLVVCNSSMAMHAAAAFRRPCIVLLGSAFVSASQHARQWAYPETRVLGRDEGRPDVWPPEQVYPLVEELASER